MLLNILHVSKNNVYLCPEICGRDLSLSKRSKILTDSKVNVLMEKKIGTINILITDVNVVEEVNALLSSYGSIILSRNGMPLRDENISIITLVVKSDGDTINSLTGKLGRLKGLKAKSTLITTA